MLNNSKKNSNIFVVEESISYTKYKQHEEKQSLPQQGVTTTLRNTSNNTETWQAVLSRQLSSRLNQEILKGVYMTPRQNLVSSHDPWGGSIYKTFLLQGVE